MMPMEQRVCLLSSSPSPPLAPLHVQQLVLLRAVSFLLFFSDAPPCLIHARRLHHEHVTNLTSFQLSTMTNWILFCATLMPKRAKRRPYELFCISTKGCLNDWRPARSCCATCLHEA